MASASRSSLVAESKWTLRHSGRCRLTPPSRRRPPASCACFRTRLMSNVRLAPWPATSLPSPQESLFSLRVSERHQIITLLVLGVAGPVSWHSSTLLPHRSACLLASRERVAFPWLPGCRWWCRFLLFSLEVPLLVCGYVRGTPNMAFEQSADTWLLSWRALARRTAQLNR